MVVYSIDTTYKKVISMDDIDYLDGYSSYELEYNIKVQNTSGGDRTYTLALSGSQSFTLNHLGCAGLDVGNHTEYGSTAGMTTPNGTQPTVTVFNVSGYTLNIKINAFVTTNYGNTNTVLLIKSNSANVNQKVLFGSYKKVRKINLQFPVMN